MIHVGLFLGRWKNNLGCKGICKRYKPTGSFINGRYRKGQKRCQVCDLFIKFDGLWCPCCGYKLRTKTRSSKSKKKLRDES